MEKGQIYKIGFNTAKRIGCEMLAYEELRVCDFGIDWILFRDMDGRAHAVDFFDKQERDEFISNLSK